MPAPYARANLAQWATGGENAYAHGKAAAKAALDDANVDAIIAGDNSKLRNQGLFQRNVMVPIDGQIAKAWNDYYASLAGSSNPVHQYIREHFSGEWTKDDDARISLTNVAPEGAAPQWRLLVPGTADFDAAIDAGQAPFTIAVRHPTYKRLNKKGVNVHDYKYVTLCSGMLRGLLRAALHHKDYTPVGAGVPLKTKSGKPIADTRKWQKFVAMAAKGGSDANAEWIRLTQQLQKYGWRQFFNERGQFLDKKAATLCTAYESKLAKMYKAQMEAEAAGILGASVLQRQLRSNVQGTNDHTAYSSKRLAAQRLFDSRLELGADGKVHWKEGENPRARRARGIPNAEAIRKYRFAGDAKALGKDATASEKEAARQARVAALSAAKLHEATGSLSAAAGTFQFSKTMSDGKVRSCLNADGSLVHPTDHGILVNARLRKTAKGTEHVVCQLVDWNILDPVAMWNWYSAGEPRVGSLAAGTKKIERYGALWKHLVDTARLRVAQNGDISFDGNHAATANTTTGKVDSLVNARQLRVAANRELAPSDFLQLVPGARKSAAGSTTFLPEEEAKREGGAAASGVPPAKKRAVEEQEEDVDEDDEDEEYYDDEDEEDEDDDEDDGSEYEDEYDEEDEDEYDEEDEDEYDEEYDEEDEEDDE